MTKRTPWAAMLVTACSLGIPPALFWRLSLTEWRALASPTLAVLTRGGFDALAQRFPDNT